MTSFRPVAILVKLIAETGAGEDEMASIAMAAATLMATAPGSPGAAAPLELLSPDRSVRVVIEASMGDASPSYRVERHGETVIAPSPLGLDILYTKNFGPFDFSGSERRTIDETHTLVATKASSARDHFNEIMVAMTERGDGRRMDLIVRAYDDGVAFRYRVPVQPQLKSISLMNERTQFNFPTDYDCIGFNTGRMDLSHEGMYEPVKSSAIRWYHLYDPPFTCKTASGKTSFLLTEADLIDYGGLYLRGRMDGGLGMASQISLRWDNRRLGAIRDISKEDLVTPGASSCSPTMRAT